MSIITINSISSYQKIHLFNLLPKTIHLVNSLHDINLSSLQMSEIRDID